MAGFFKAAGEGRLRGEEFRADELVDLGWGLSRMGRVHVGEEWTMGYLKVCVGAGYPYKNAFLRDIKLSW